MKEWKLQSVCLPNTEDCDDFCQPGRRAFYIGWGERSNFLYFQRQNKEDKLKLCSCYHSKGTCFIAGQLRLR